MNPFADDEDEDKKDGTNPFDDSPPAAATNGGTNPFDFDAGFQTTPPPKKEQVPILLGMDSHDSQEAPPVTASIKKTPGAPRMPTVKVSELTGQVTGWLRKNKAEDQHVEYTSDQEDDDEEKREMIPEWPYDYYHEQQQIYYDALDARPKDDKKEDSYVTRPADLPDIPTAVQGLSLVDFEKVAQERAIGIVSTWIYDQGLMQDLIVSQISDDQSVKTSEGVEIGARGYPMDGNTIDKEIDKLRNSTTRELSLINARLNDGVAASGSEVQELVNAVTATKGDLGKLRELTTYISQGSTANSSLVANYPRLKTAIHARRNIAKCFSELDFFAQISATCDRLREDMHNSEWTEEEWTTLRNVCREHVELEVFLVEAEQGMKARIDQERTPTDSSFRKKRSAQSRSAGGGSYASVDKFLEEHVTNVWELGDEIRLRVLSGVGTTFDLALNNPAGMVALVEAVELYEAASEEYRIQHGEKRDGRLHFTDMRRGALEQVAKDFEVRGLEVFQEVQQMAADSADEDYMTANFNAVLRASNNLTNQMDFVTHQMAPCFPKYWALEALWTSVVADVCSQQILGQIGGKDGQRLPDLTVTQLLDLVAWIESFREKISDAFPDLIDMQEELTNAPKPSIESGASLLHGDRKEIDVERAKDSVKWIIDVMWEVHRLAQDEFLVRTRSQTEGWLENVYTADHAKTQSAEGRLTTSLCEDVYALVGVQLRTVRERLTKRSEVLVLAVGVVFSYLRMKQLECRDAFLTDLETCCAAANDFIRMSEHCEEILSDIERATNLSSASLDTLNAQSNELLTLYSSDAVYAAQRVHVYIFEPIEEEIGEALFSLEWEESLTHNELALTLVRTLEDYMGDLEIWLEELMVRKVVDALVISTINFYIKCLLQKSAKAKNESTFKDPPTALLRIKGDIAIIREYFESLTETFPALERVIENEFDVLEAIHEILMIAAGRSSDDIEELLFVIQRKVKDIDVTRLTMGDLWHLVNPQEERSVYEIVDEHEMTLNAMAPTGPDIVDSRNTDVGLRLDQVILHTVTQSKRKRPLKPGAVANMEKMMAKIKVPWTNGGGAAEGDHNEETEA